MLLYLVQYSNSCHDNNASNDNVNQESLDEKLERLTDKAKEVMDELEQLFNDDIRDDDVSRLKVRTGAYSGNRTRIISLEG